MPEQLPEDLCRQLSGVEGLSLGGDSESKSGTALLNTLMVRLFNANTVNSFVQILGTWLARDRTRTLKIQVGTNQIEASGLSGEEQRRLIEWFQLQAGMRFEK